MSTECTRQIKFQSQPPGQFRWEMAPVHLGSLSPHREPLLRALAPSHRYSRDAAAVMLWQSKDTGEMVFVGKAGSSWSNRGCLLFKHPPLQFSIQAARGSPLFGPGFEFSRMRRWWGIEGWVSCGCGRGTRFARWAWLTVNHLLLSSTATASDAAVNSATSRAAVMTSCSLYLSEEISLVQSSSSAGILTLFSKNHNTWNSFGVDTAWFRPQQSKLVPFKIGKVWLLNKPETSTLRSRALVGFGLWWTPQALLGFHLWWTSQRKPHDYALIKRDGPRLGLLWLKASEAPQSCSATPSSPQSLHSSSHVVHLASILSIASIQRRTCRLYPLQKYGQRSKEDTKRQGSTSV